MKAISILIIFQLIFFNVSNAISEDRKTKESKVSAELKEIDRFNRSLKPHELNIDSETSLYRMLYRKALGTTSIKDVASLMPISNNLDKITSQLSAYSFKKHGKHPAFVIFPAKKDKKLGYADAKPYVLRWNVKTQKYEKAYSLPVETDIIVIHDPNRILSEHREKICKKENAEQHYEEVYSVHNMWTMLNDMSTMMTRRDNNLRWQDKNKLPKSGTYKKKTIEYSPQNKEVEEWVLQFPVVRVPKVIHFVKQTKEGKKELVKTEPSKFIKFYFRFSGANRKMGLDTGGHSEVDPQMDVVMGGVYPLCIPIDGHEKSCEESGGFPMYLSDSR